MKFVDAMKILVSFAETEEKPTSKFREATQADWDRLAMS